MDFFERQRRARRKTARLILCYLAGVFSLFLSVHLQVAAQAALFAANEYEGGSEEAAAVFAADPKFLLADFLGVLLLVGGGTLYKVIRLRKSDGDGVARRCGGRLLRAGNASPREARLVNIAEEMALASGAPVPNVYLLPNEPSINAMTAGLTPSTSVIAVTQGALDYLSRDELQGLVAHEFSHILNRDTRLNTRLIGILFGLDLIARVGQSLLFIGAGKETPMPGESRNPRVRFKFFVVLFRLLTWPFFVFGLFLAVFGWGGHLFADIIRAAVSRQREYLADAAAVQYTRNPDGIAGALKKSGSRVGTRIRALGAAEFPHLFFGNIFGKGFFARLFDTHPDLILRIRQIDPSFQGDFPKNLRKT